jgi:hypothetical protein
MVGRVLALMLVPDEVRKCVVFIGLQKADLSFHMAGSGFLLTRGAEGGGGPGYLVTARHVIDGIRNLGLTKVFVRINRTNWTAVWLESELSNWFVHPTDTSVDVAITLFGVWKEMDHLYITFNSCATQEKLSENEVGLGDEVFITGLFRHHHGQQRNIPIVRVGNIACLTEEKIITGKYGEIDAYLIEARSIGGLSGSPVFVNLGVVRKLAGKIRFAEGDPRLLLLGLIHGHFDVKAHDIDTQDQDSLTPEKVNTGIAMVVPFQRIAEVIALHMATLKTEDQSNIACR